MSSDIKFPSVAKSLASAQGRRVLILGNSLVKEDLKLDLLEREVGGRAGIPVNIAGASTVNTYVNDWYYVYKHHFNDAQLSPDVLVICFAMNHLEDKTIRSGGVARYHSSIRDVPDIFRDDVRDFDGRVDFLLDKLSVSYTFRTTRQQRILDLVVPHYYESANRVNEALRMGSPKLDGGGEYHPSFRHFEKLLEMARHAGVQVIVVAMPVSFTYPLNPQIESMVETAGMNFIDTRLTEGIDAKSFADSLHMNDDGATAYSRALAAQLSKYLE